MQICRSHDSYRPREIRSQLRVRRSDEAEGSDRLVGRKGCIAAAAITDASSAAAAAATADEKCKEEKKKRQPENTWL